MPAEAFWFIDKRVILQIISGVLTVKDLIESRQQVDAFAIHGIAPTYMVSDVSGVQRFPLDFRAMRDVYGGQQKWNVASIVLVGTNPLLPVFISGLSPLLRFQMRVVRTREAAFSFLQEIDPSLKPLFDAKRAAAGS